MPLIPLPHSLIAFGEEPRGEKVNVYKKMKTLYGIFNALDDGEQRFISWSLFGRLLKFPNSQPCPLALEFSYWVDSWRWRSQTRFGCSSRVFLFVFL